LELVKGATAGVPFRPRPPRSVQAETAPSLKYRIVLTVRSWSPRLSQKGTGPFWAKAHSLPSTSTANWTGVPLPALATLSISLYLPGRVATCPCRDPALETWPAS
jgi:hypothetical protein